MCTSLNILLLLLLCSNPWSTMCFRPRLILPWNLPLFLQEVKEYVRTYRFPNDCIVVSAGPRVWHAVPWRGISTGPNRDPKLRVRRSLVKGWAARARAFCTHGLMTWFLWISWRNGLPWWLTVCVQFVFLFPGSLSYDESIFSLFSSRSLWLMRLDTSLELTPLSHRKAMSRMKRIQSSGTTTTGSSRNVPPSRYSPGPLLIGHHSSFYRFWWWWWWWPKSGRCLPIVSSCFPFSCTVGTTNKCASLPPQLTVHRSRSQLTTLQYYTVASRRASDTSVRHCWALTRMRMRWVGAARGLPSWLPPEGWASTRKPVTRHGASSPRRGVGSYSA